MYKETIGFVFPKNGDQVTHKLARTYITARMQMCILRSVSLCLRGSRNPWRGAGFVDAASLPPIVRDIE